MMGKGTKARRRKLKLIFPPSQLLNFLSSLHSLKGLEIPAGVVEYIDTESSVETDETEEEIDIRADYARVMEILKS